MKHGPLLNEFILLPHVFGRFPSTPGFQDDRCACWSDGLLYSMPIWLVCRPVESVEALKFSFQASVNGDGIFIARQHTAADARY